MRVSGLVRGWSSRMLWCHVNYWAAWIALPQTRHIRLHSCILSREKSTNNGYSNDNNSSQFADGLFRSRPNVSSGVKEQASYTELRLDLQDFYYQLPPPKSHNVVTIVALRTSMRLCHYVLQPNSMKTLIVWSFSNMIKAWYCLCYDKSVVVAYANNEISYVVDRTLSSVAWYSDNYLSVNTKSLVIQISNHKPTSRDCIQLKRHF